MKMYTCLFVVVVAVVLVNKLDPLVHLRSMQVRPVGVIALADAIAMLQKQKIG